ncbi:hypothetical protein DF3PB_4550005 [uncultured Defluviicoccus sp.]|uniref:Uncharacterized protein n=1 Tax=metagenome TaxID=256318 RepID=A0A380TH63_9ZZZZ|nr:hypothetical protein DF3PB_420006 [uncultured Defluviicoccus sp.]SUS07532.1 hypothetical protein DF3PB_4550005 [uncultured Defluviicoccus sp.]
MFLASDSQPQYFMGGFARSRKYARGLAAGCCDGLAALPVSGTSGPARGGTTGKQDRQST